MSFKVIKGLEMIISYYHLKMIHFLIGGGFTLGAISAGVDEAVVAATLAGTGVAGATGTAGTKAGITGGFLFYC